MKTLVRFMVVSLVMIMFYPLSSSFAEAKKAPVKDTVSPVTTVTIESKKPQKFEWYSSNVTITFKAKDDKSGVKKTEYRVNKMEWWDYKKPHIVSHDGIYKFEYRSIDKNGNKEKIKSFVIKFDKRGPVIYGAKDKTISVGSKFDPRAGVETWDIINHKRDKYMTIDGTVDTTKPGKYTLTYTVADLFPHTTVLKRVITVVEDHTKPVIKGATNKTIRLKSSFNAKSGVSAKDNIDGNLTSKIKVNGKVNTKKRGVYKVTYTVTDGAGNKATVTRKITVK